MLKKEIAGIVILLLFSLNMAAEKCTEGLTFNGFSGGLVCGQEKLSPKELPLLLRQVPEANELYLQGKNLSKAGMVPLTIGSFALGWGLGVSLFKGPLTSSAGPAFIIGGIGLSIGLPIVAVSIGKTKRQSEYTMKNKTVALLSMEISVNSIVAVWDFETVEAINGSVKILSELCSFNKFGTMIMPCFIDFESYLTAVHP